MSQSARGRVGNLGEDGSWKKNLGKKKAAPDDDRRQTTEDARRRRVVFGNVAFDIIQV